MGTDPVATKGWEVSVWEILDRADVEVVRRDLRRLAVDGSFSGRPPEWACRLAELLRVGPPEAAAPVAWPWLAEQYRDRLLAVASGVGSYRRALAS